MLKGVCLPDTSEDSNESSSMSTITSSEPSSTDREQYRQTGKNKSYFTEMQHYDAWSRNGNGMWQGQYSYHFLGWSWIWIWIQISLQARYFPDTLLIDSTWCSGKLVLTCMKMAYWGAEFPRSLFGHSNWSGIQISIKLHLQTKYEIYPIHHFAYLVMLTFWNMHENAIIRFFGFFWSFFIYKLFSLDLHIIFYDF